MAEPTAPERACRRFQLVRREDETGISGTGIVAYGAEAEQHTPDQPTDYRAWHAWAEEMTKTHRQRRCPGCGLYKIWIPKEKTEAREARGHGV